ncbi:MAG: putative lipid II flippase FtsW [Kiritimatiellia bacterium]
MPGSVRSREPAPSDEDVRSPASARVVVLCVFLLFGISLTMLVSIGIGQQNPLHYPVRQAIWGIVALGSGIVTACIPVNYWRKGMPWMCVLAIILLLMARLVGRNIFGAHRWLSLGPINFQPSELAKLSAILWVAVWLSVYRRRAQEFVRGFLLPAAGLGVLCLMVLIGPDYGTTMLIGGTGMLIMYFGGSRVIYLLGAAGIAGTGMGFLIYHNPERLSRVTSFLNPEKYADDASYQLMNSLYAFIEGGLWGKGIGQSLQKFSYLPEAHTDFILAILAEEFGLVGVGIVLVLYLALFIAGMHISLRCKDSFARMTGFGITALITLQAVINVGVVTGSMPTKGLPLPFVSYGGSSLVFTSVMVGILIRIANGGGRSDEQTRTLRGSQQWI